jgi:tetratricopeptide (TPR) repeat protein
LKIRRNQGQKKSFFIDVTCSAKTRCTHPLCKKKRVIYNPLLTPRLNMTLQAHPIRRIFARFFPRKYTLASSEQKSWEVIPSDQKKELAVRYLIQGESALLNGNLSALSLFESASQLDPENPEIWYRQGLAFFEYGSEEGKEKALLVAAKHFKFALQQNPLFFSAYVAWGNTLLQLGRFHMEHHFLLEAKEKYQKALEISQDQPNEILGELYWDYGIVWSEIAKQSGEALDLRLAIDAFHKSKQMQQYLPSEFFNDFGKAYLEMGLLINDSRLYFQAIEMFQKAIAAAPQYFDGWVSLAESYSQLYINTMDERFAIKASDAYASAIKMSPQDPEVWLSWAQILAESGRLNGDMKLVRLSIEKCARAATIDTKNPVILSQWVESLALLGSLTSRLDLLIEAENKILKATDLFPDDPDLWHAYGICLIAFGRYYEDPEYFEMAIEKLQWGLSMDRTSAEHWHALGIVHKLYADLIEDETLLERANRFFARAIDLKPACPGLLFDAAAALLQHSEMTDNLPSLEKAIRHLETLLQTHKDTILHHPEWLFEYASALQWLGSFTSEEIHFTRALEIFSHVLLLNPDFSQIHNRMALCYMELGHLTGEADFFKKAIYAFRLAVRQDEENDQIWLDWGLCLIHLAHHIIDVDFMNQLYADAEQKLSRAGQLGNSGAYYNLACLYSILGRTAEAMNFIQKSLLAKALPPLEEIAQDEWLDHLRSTSVFTQFFTALEAKLSQAREE